VKAVVVYDSVYGNTESVAKSIARHIEASGHTAEVLRAKDAIRANVDGELLVVGSPTRMGTMTGKMKRFLKQMDAAPLKGSTVAAFDTEVQDVIEKNGASAAAKMHDIARSRGLKVHTPVLKVGVTGIRGPLAQGWEASVEAYVVELLRSAGYGGPRTLERSTGADTADGRDNLSHRKGS